MAFLVVEGGGQLGLACSNPFSSYTPLMIVQHSLLQSCIFDSFIRRPLLSLLQEADHESNASHNISPSNFRLSVQVKGAHNLQLTKQVHDMPKNCPNAFEVFSQGIAESRQEQQIWLDVNCRMQVDFGLLQRPYKKRVLIT